MKLISPLFSNLVMTAIAVITTLSFVFASPLEATERIREAVSDEDQPPLKKQKTTPTKASLMKGLSAADPARGGFYVLCTNYTHYDDQTVVQKTVKTFNKQGRVVYVFPAVNTAQQLIVDETGFYVASENQNFHEIYHYDGQGALTKVLSLPGRRIEAFAVKEGKIYVVTRNSSFQDGRVSEFDENFQRTRDFDIDLTSLGLCPSSNSCLAISNDDRIYVVGSTSQINEITNFKNLRVLPGDNVKAITVHTNRLYFRKDNPAKGVYTINRMMLDSNDTHELYRGNLENIPFKGHFIIPRNPNEIYTSLSPFTSLIDLNYQPIHHGQRLQHVAMQWPVYRINNEGIIEEFQVGGAPTDITEGYLPVSRNLQFMENNLEVLARKAQKPFTDIVVKQAEE
jgi:hypothetical protein